MGPIGPVSAAYGGWWCQPPGWAAGRGWMRVWRPRRPLWREEYSFRLTLVVFWRRGRGFQFRRWRVDGGQNHHAGLHSGHGRAGGRHRADRRAVRWRRLPGLEGSRGGPSSRWATPGRRLRVPLRDGLRMRWMIYLCGGCPPAPAAGQLPLFTRTPCEQRANSEE